jgi:hypothetical protein
VKWWKGSFHIVDDCRKPRSLLVASLADDETKDHALYTNFNTNLNRQPMSHFLQQTPTLCFSPYIYITRKFGPGQIWTPFSQTSKASSNHYFQPTIPSLPRSQALELAPLSCASCHPLSEACEAPPCHCSLHGHSHSFTSVLSVPDRLNFT